MWILPGIDGLGGSGMSGHGQYAVLGVIVELIGIWLLQSAIRGAADDCGSILGAWNNARQRPSQLPQINRRLRSIEGAASDTRWRSSVVADLQDNLAWNRVTLFRREGIASIGQWQHLTNNRSQLSRINPA